MELAALWGRGSGLVPGHSLLRESRESGLLSGRIAKPHSARRVQSEGTRYLDIRENDELDERQFIAWVEQASRLPGRRM